MSPEAFSPNGRIPSGAMRASVERWWCSGRWGTKWARWAATWSSTSPWSCWTSGWGLTRLKRMSSRLRSFAEGGRSPGLESERAIMSSNSWPLPKIQICRITRITKITGNDIDYHQEGRLPDKQRQSAVEPVVGLREGSWRAGPRPLQVQTWYIDYLFLSLSFIILYINFKQEIEKGIERNWDWN